MLSYACPQCNQQLTLPAVQTSQAYRCPRCGRASRPAVPGEARPDRVAGYEILEELGRGAMGVVYKARQPSLGRLVALKMILDGTMASADQRVRFRREAEAVARLNHPHIVHIHEIGEHGDRPFFSMEHVGGGSLAERLNGTPLAPRLAARMAEQLSRAVQHAHQQGIVHRDLKPANILLSERRGDSLSGTLPLASGSYAASAAGSTEARTFDPNTAAGTVDLPNPKITDFGLAKQLDNNDGPTGSGAIVGTPSYMAPEQALGNNQQIGPAADIWALGATLYEMLTGVPPFRGANVAETLIQVTLEEPVPPRQLQPGVPRDLEIICLKCLTKAPARRYASAESLGDDLHRFLEGLPIQARPVGRVERVLKWARRRPAAAGIIVLAVLSLAALQAASLSLAGYEYRQRHVAESLTNQAESARIETEASAKETEQSAKKEAEARQEADRRRDQGVLDSEIARLALADQALDRGIDLCANQGDVRQGLLWLTRGLELAQVAQPRNRARAARLERAARLNLTAWTGRLPARVVHLLPHPGAVESASFHPQRPLAATGSSDGAVGLWDTTTGQPVGGVLPHTGPVRCLAWSRDGKLLAVGTGDGWQAYGNGVRSKGEARVWDVASGQPRTPPLKHDGTVWAIDISPDGERLLTGCNDHQARVWNLAEVSAPKMVKHDHAVTGAVFLPDGSSFVTATCASSWESWSRTAQLRTWDSTTFKPRGPVILLNNVRTLSVLADTGRALTGSNNSEIQLWDLATGMAVDKPLATGSNVVSLGVSRDGAVILAGGADYRVRAYESETRRRLGPELYMAAPLNAVALAPDGQSFLTADTYSARLWRLDRTAPRDVPLAGASRIKRSLMSAAASHVLTELEPGGELQVWDSTTGKARGKAFRPAGGTKLIDLSRDGQKVLVANSSKKLQLYNSVTGEAVGKEVTVGDVLDIKIGPDGTLAVAGCRDKTIYLCDLSAGKLLNKVEVNNLPNTVCFAPDGKSVLSGTWSSTVYQFSVPDLKPIGRPVGVHGAVSGLASTEDGKIFVAGAHGPMNSIMGRTATGKTIGLPLRHHARVAAFAPSGQIALTGNDQSLRLWDVASGKQVGPSLIQPGGEPGWGLRTVAFADDRTLVSVRTDGVVRRWPVPEPVAGSPEMLGLWVQSLTGMSLDALGGVSTLSAEDWEKVQQKLDMVR